jgi:hypothetical protein
MLDAEAKGSLQRIQANQEAINEADCRKFDEKVMARAFRASDGIEACPDTPTPSKRLKPEMVGVTTAH